MRDYTYIKLYRRTLKNRHVMKDAHHLAIWVWLLMNACKFPVEVDFGGEIITLKPGQYTTGRKEIAKALGVNENKVYRVLKRFESEHLIEQQTDHHCTLITIVQWDKYQEDEQPIEQEMNNQRTTSEQPVNTNQESKESKKVNNNRRFAPPSVDDVRAYCQERKNKVDPEAFVDFYTSKNWMVGKNKMKDWKAAVRNWERMEAGRSRQDTSKSSAEPPRYKDYKPEARNAVPMSAEQKANREKILQGVSDFIKEA